MRQAPDTATIERFLHGQVECWNAHDRDGFVGWYREIAPDELRIDYAGRGDKSGGLEVIEEMFDQHNANISLDVVSTIINGNEAALHHRNCIVGTGLAIESIETYWFEVGRLFVCYYLLPPGGDGVDLEQFRGLAQR
jgi:hypothetical protein